jgi:hypothetical protein
VTREEFLKLQTQRDQLVKLYQEAKAIVDGQVLEIDALKLSFQQSQATVISLQAEIKLLTARIANFGSSETTL